MVIYFFKSHLKNVQAMIFDDQMIMAGQSWTITLDLTNQLVKL